MRITPGTPLKFTEKLEMIKSGKEQINGQGIKCLFIVRSMKAGDCGGLYTFVLSTSSFVSQHN